MRSYVHAKAANWPEPFSFVSDEKNRPVWRVLTDAETMGFWGERGHCSISTSQTCRSHHVVMHREAGVACLVRRDGKASFCRKNGLVI